LGDGRAGVDPDVLAGDESVPELEDVQDADADVAAMARYAHQLAGDLCGPDLVVHGEVLTVETVLDVGVLALDVAEQVSVALAHGARSVQLAGRVADHVVDNIVGKGLERAFDVAVGFPAEVVLR